MCTSALWPGVGTLHTTSPIEGRVVAARTPRFGWARSRVEWLVVHRAPILAAGAISAIAAGFLLTALGEASAGRWVWRVAVAVLAAGKARRELTALVQRAPKHTQLRDAEGIREIPVDAVRTGDVALVQKAASSRAPFVRMADRYAGFFLPATLLVAGIA